MTLFVNLKVSSQSLSKVLFKNSLIIDKIYELHRKYEGIFAFEVFKTIPRVSTGLTAESAFCHCYQEASIRRHQLIKKRKMNPNFYSKTF